MPVLLLMMMMNRGRRWRHGGRRRIARAGHKSTGATKQSTCALMRVATLPRRRRRSIADWPPSWLLRPMAPRKLVPLHTKHKDTELWMIL